MAIIIAATLAGLIPSPVEANEPHMSNDSPPMERIVKLSGGKQSKGPRARVDAKENAGRYAKGSGSFMIPGANEFMPSGNYRLYQKPLPAGRPGKIQKGPFDPDQDQRKSRCKSEVQETKPYNIKSQIGNHKK